MDILTNKNCPFTVPDGYFADLQTRVMNRIEAHEKQNRTLWLNPWQMLIAAAACILLIFTPIALMHSKKQPLMTKTQIDDDLYKWLYASEKATQLAQTLDIDTQMPELTEICDEDRAIISFLERDNISVAAIVHAFSSSY